MSARLVEPSAQPDIVRAAQKDSFYIARLSHACQDAVASALGPRFSLMYSKEIRAASEAIYYSCTNGCQLQTLGEEFCDLIQVTGPGWDQAPGALRRILHIIMKVIVPYLIQKYGTRLEGLTPAEVLGNIEEEEEDGLDPEGEGEGTDTRDDSSRASTSLQASAPASPATPAAASTWRERWRALRRRLLLRVRPLLAFLMRFFPTLKQVLDAILKLHLTAFYFHGWYYQIAKRVTDIRYLFVGRMLEPRPHYRVLGYMVAAQLGLGAVTYIGSTLLPWLSLQNQQQHRMVEGASSSAEGGQRATGEAGTAEAAQGKEEGGAKAAVAVLSGGGSVHNAASSAAAVVKGVRAAQRTQAENSTCPLCLTPKKVPTCPPCGHVYCWRCITEWTLQRTTAECSCPICRAPFKPNELCAIYAAEL